MVRMITAVLPADSNAWVFNQNNTCPKCGTVYRIERSDRQLSKWYKPLETFGLFPKSRWVRTINGPKHKLPFMVMDEVGGLRGPWVLSRCIECHSYCYTAKEGSEPD